MTTQQERIGDDDYEANNDATPEVSAEVQDNDYTTTNRPGESNEVPVVSDNIGAQELEQNSFPANSDAQLEEDDRNAIDQDNIISGRTRGAKPVASYSEGPDEDDLPAEVNEQGIGVSSLRQ